MTTFNRIEYVTSSHHDNLIAHEFSVSNEAGEVRHFVVDDVEEGSSHVAIASPFSRSLSTTEERCADVDVIVAALSTLVTVLHDKGD